ncbi:outer membrane beta-barrel protein [Gilvimarinus polysaccharolyticus]|uniref:outer membrane beta-barrel protein n=1 Tax=Gilvimarinus polysaccharolyticus TaxID=863921 RepID=UPI0006733AD6|nr:outer membrane beta-barrel protein [Gilvimarinus polysaccharolyticus]
MKLTRILLTFALPATLLLSNPSVADNERGFFAGIGASAINADDEKSYDGADLWIAELMAGYKYNSFLGGEVRYGTSLGADTVFLDGEDTIEVDMDINHYRAIYYRAEATNQHGRFYGLLGYVDLDYRLENTDFSADGFSWGVGFGWFVAPKLNLNFEYKNLLDVDDQDFTSISVNLDYRF